MSDEQGITDAIERLREVKNEMDASGVGISAIVEAVLGPESDEEMVELVRAAMTSREGAPISDKNLAMGIIKLHKWRTELT
jgi:biotin synthase-related radical SAM superfamily protein|tara:strand:- start:1957 stop:2199 length:243 start_codon:yes stop_codon:yes gene_type:complete